MKEDSAKREPLVLRILKLLVSVDWKSMLLLISFVGGVGGAVWNKVEGLINEKRTERVQEGTYEALAQRIDELYARCESGSCCGIPEKDKATEPARSPASFSVQAIESEVKEAMSSESMPSPKLEFKRARLPGFRSIQRAAGLKRDVAKLLENNEDQ